MTDERISRRQMLAAAFVALLSPVARRFPSSLVMVSGSASWLSPIVAALPVLLMILFMARLLRGGRGLGEVFELSLGRVAGRLFVLLISLWLTFYSGFILRSAAYRFTSTVYPSAQAWLFVIVTALACLPMVIGSFAAIARSAVLFRPLLLAALAAVFVFALGDCDFRGLFALREDDLLPVLRSSFTVLNTLSVVVYLGFAEPRCSEEFRSRSYILWAAVLLVLTEFICLCCLGVFGAELTVKLNYPFFMLVRDISIFDSFARMEALIIALWIFADAVHISLLMWVAAGNFSRCLSLPRRACALGVSFAAALAGLTMPSGMLGVGLFSERIVPFGNAMIIFVLLPLAAFVGWIRRKI